MKQHTLVTYSIFELQIKIAVVCLKLSFFLCKEKETHQSCLRVSRVYTDVNEASESASRAARREWHSESEPCANSPKSGTWCCWWHCWSCTVDWYHGTQHHITSVLYPPFTAMPMPGEVVHLLGRSSHLTSGAHSFCPAPSLPPEVSGAVAISLHQLVPYFHYRCISEHHPTDGTPSPQLSLSQKLLEGYQKVIKSVLCL